MGQDTIVVFMVGLAVVVARDVIIIIIPLVQAVVVVAIQAGVVHADKITGVQEVVVVHTPHLVQTHHQVHQDYGKVMVK